MIPAYFDTRFRTSDAHPSWPDAFGIISAQATTGESWSDEENAAADGRLQEDLAVLNRWFTRVTGYSPNTPHAEPSWAVALSLQEALDIGRRYSQDAIYYVDGDRLSVMKCTEPTEAALVGAFRERVDP